MQRVSRWIVGIGLAHRSSDRAAVYTEERPHANVPENTERGVSVRRHSYTARSRRSKPLVKQQLLAVAGYHISMETAQGHIVAVTNGVA
jgi:hypothetical protein